MTIITTPPSVPDLFGTSPADLVPHGDGHTSTADEARERADRIRAGLPSYVQMRQDIADAYAARDWAALDYASWPEYVMAEFGPDLLRLSRGERQEAVQDLRGQGMSTRQIGNAVGVSEGTVRNDLAKVRSDYAPEDKPAPERVNGSDGKSYPAKKATKAPAERVSRSDRPAGSDSRSETGAATGQGPRPVADLRTPHADPGREKARLAARARDAGRTAASRIVPDIQTAVVTIGNAVKLGERDLITAEMVRQCREAVDLLEAILKGEA